MAFFAKETETMTADPVKYPNSESGSTIISSPITDDANVKRDQSDRSADHLPRRAFLDQGCKVSGKLTFEKPVQINGQIDGEIDARAEVIIGQSAVVTAQINALSIIISGTVNGELVASERIEIQQQAKVTGKITAPRLLVQEGAIFDGQCTMQPDAVRHRETTQGTGKARNQSADKFAAERSPRDHNGSPLSANEA